MIQALAKLESDTSSGHCEVPSPGPKCRDEEIHQALVRHMPTNCQQIRVERDPRSGALVLAGRVRTYYNKQVFYHLCRRLAQDCEVVDEIVVATGEAAYCWTVPAQPDD